MKTSKSGIHFKVDKNVNDKLTLQSDGFEIENCSSLPLRMNLRFDPSQCMPGEENPYSIFEEGIKNKNVIIEPGHQVSVIFIGGSHWTDLLGFSNWYQDRWHQANQRQSLKAHHE